jgi:hypothetical protein
MFPLQGAITTSVFHGNDGVIHSNYKTITYSFKVNPTYKPYEAKGDIPKLIMKLFLPGLNKNITLYDLKLICNKEEITWQRMAEANGPIEIKLKEPVFNQFTLVWEYQESDKTTQYKFVANYLATMADAKKWLAKQAELLNLPIDEKAKDSKYAEFFYELVHDGFVLPSNFPLNKHGKFNSINGIIKVKLKENILNLYTWELVAFLTTFTVAQTKQWIVNPEHGIVGQKYKHNFMKGYLNNHVLIITNGCIAQTMRFYRIYLSL